MKYIPLRPGSLFSVVSMLLAIAIFCVASSLSARVRRDVKSIAAAAPAAQKLKTKIDSILHKKNIDAAIIASIIETGETIYERESDQLMIPASVNKLFTTYATLKKLKPTSTFKTTIYTVGTLKDKVLAGDLYLKGGGDPSLVSERLWMLVNELVRSGIKTVTGNLIADSSYFDTETTPESRPKYLKDQAYNAPIGALSFNFNTTTIYVKPGESPGASPVVYTDPENSYIDVVNQATTGKAESKNTVVVSRTDFVKGDIGDTVLLRGSIPLDGHEMRFYKNIVNPALYTAHMFKTFWEQRGLKIQGNVTEGLVPANAKQILEFESLPLWQIIWGMNKFSNNFVADMILKKLGAEVWGPPGTLQKGVTAMRDTLEDIKIDPKAYQIQDGSGLTRNTKVTARQILSVLMNAQKDFSMAPEFIASLGIAGEDGTIKKRFPNSAVQGILRAKTGTLDGVNALAGYLPSADGEMVAFVILLNDSKGKYGRMTPWVDQIAEAIGKYSRNKSAR